MTSATKTPGIIGKAKNLAVKSAKFAGNRLWYRMQLQDGAAMYDAVMPKEGVAAWIRGLFRRTIALMVNNLHDEAQVRGMKYSQILACWGIHNETHLQQAVSFMKTRRASGVLLFFLSTALWTYQTFFLAQPLYWKSLHGIAALSLMALGMSLWLTAQWRLTVFRKRRFVPFLLWLKNFGRFPE